MPRSELRQNLLTLALAFASCQAAATDVFVTSVSPTQVQLIVDGKTARTLRLEEVSPEGVKLIEIKGSAALLQVDGRTVQLGLGQATVRSTALRADRQGHFMVQAVINNLAWGLDDRIYGAGGTNGAHVVPGDKPDAKPVAPR